MKLTLNRLLAINKIWKNKEGKYPPQLHYKVEGKCEDDMRHGKGINRKFCSKIVFYTCLPLLLVLASYNAFPPNGNYTNGPNLVQVKDESIIGDNFILNLNKIGTKLLSAK